MLARVTRLPDPSLKIRIDQTPCSLGLVGREVRELGERVDDVARPGECVGTGADVWWENRVGGGEGPVCLDLGEEGEGGVEVGVCGRRWWDVCVHGGLGLICEIVSSKRLNWGVDWVAAAC